MPAADLPAGVPRSLRNCHSEPESLQPREVVGFALVESRPQNDGKETDMSDWLHNLPVLWMSLVVFGFTYLVTAAIYVAVSVFAVGERALVQGNLPWLAADLGYPLRPFRCVHREPGLD